MLQFGRHHTIFGLTAIGLMLVAAFAVVCTRWEMNRRAHAAERALAEGLEESIRKEVVELLGRLMLMLVALSELMAAVEVSEHVGQSLMEIGGVVRAAGETVFQAFETGRGFDWAVFSWSSG
jgi:hypothetical protein